MITPATAKIRYCMLSFLSGCNNIFTITAPAASESSNLNQRLEAKGNLNMFINGQI